MKYYKIIINNIIIGVGTRFLKWYNGQQQYMYCNLEQSAQAVQDIISEKLYTTDWLKNIPPTAWPLDSATVVLINESEYDELYAQLSNGEEVPVPEPEPEPIPDPTPEEPDEETPMTIAQMREAIKTLNAMVMTENVPFKAVKTYYTGDFITNGSRLYIAISVIVQDETVIPGVNCNEVNIADVINNMREQE